MSLTPFRRKTRKRPTGNLDGWIRLIDDLTKNKRQNKLARTDIYENDGKVFYELELPGKDKENVDIKIDEKKLTVAVTREEREEDEEKNYIKRNRKQKGFKKKFPLPEKIKREEISAEFEQGILRIKVPFEKERTGEETINVHID